VFGVLVISLNGVELQLQSSLSREEASEIARAVLERHHREVEHLHSALESERRRNADILSWKLRKRMLLAMERMK